MGTEYQQPGKKSCPAPLLPGQGLSSRARRRPPLPSCPFPKAGLQGCPGLEMEGGHWGPWAQPPSSRGAGKLPLQGQPLPGRGHRAHW